MSAYGLVTSRKWLPPVREIPNGYADGTDAIRYQVSLAELRHALGSPGPND